MTAAEVAGKLEEKPKVLIAKGQQKSQIVHTADLKSETGRPSWQKSKYRLVTR